MSDRVLDVSNLGVAVRTPTGWRAVVHEVSFGLAPRQTLALVGESGSGKSISALAIMRLLNSRSARTTSGTVELDRVDLLALPERAMTRIRGRRVAMIFQEPMTALNPLMTVGAQVAESAELASGKSRAEAWSEAVRMLDRVGIADADRRAASFPHELSGGMRQRVMIAIALVARPAVLIADEPTTALDVTIQAQILSLLQSLQEETGLALLLITHDFGVVARMADQAAVIYAGRIVERGATDDILERPLHPYTRGLLACIPSLERPAARLTVIPGTVPSAGDEPSGCAFHPRCELGRDEARCRDEVPAAGAFADGRIVRCWKAEA